MGVAGMRLLTGIAQTKAVARQTLPTLNSWAGQTARNVRVNQPRETRPQGISSGGAAVPSGGSKIAPRMPSIT
jgi:hypothetical protein